MDPAAQLYLHAVRAALAFDPALAERVAAEAEDHLAEAEEARGGAVDPHLCLGPPDAFAHGIAAAHGPQRLAGFLKLLLTALLLVTLTMRLRLAFLPPLEAEAWLWPARLADRWGLIAATLAAALAGVGLWRQRRGKDWHLSPRRLAWVGGAALLLSSLGGGVLTAVGIATQPTWGAMIPLATTAAEGVALLFLAGEYRRVRRYPGLV